MKKLGRKMKLKIEIVLDGKDTLIQKYDVVREVRPEIGHQCASVVANSVALALNLKQEDDVKLISFVATPIIEKPPEVIEDQQKKLTPNAE